MSTLPPGYKSMGPFYVPEQLKSDFAAKCRAEGKKMEEKHKELINEYVYPVKKPDVPVEVPNVGQ
jgi:hypothetical protein